jgi:hypothetical protein
MAERFHSNEANSRKEQLVESDNHCGGHYTDNERQPKGPQEGTALVFRRQCGVERSA